MDIIEDLNDKEIFYENELQKTNQKKFKIRTK